MKIPLLHDHHNHPLMYTAITKGIDLSATVTPEECLVKIEEEIKRRTPGDRITAAFGWKSNRYALPEKSLHELGPVLICDQSLHGFFLNRSAADLFPGAGTSEDVLPDLMRFIFETSDITAPELRLFYEDLTEQGIHIAEDMYFPHRNGLQLLDETELTGRTKLWTALPIFTCLPERDRKRIHGIKIFTDGAIGSGTAAIRGMDTPLFSNAALSAEIEAAADTGKAISIHAIGGLAIDQTAACLTDLRTKISRAGEIRVEHAQFISKETALQYRNLGIILSMQPNFSYDSVQYTDRLPADLLPLNNQFRMLIDDAGFIPGKDLIFGSDGMPHGVRFALQQSLFPPYPGQILTPEEFVDGYCLPNFSRGYIDVDIDAANRRVMTSVVPNNLPINPE